MKKAIVLLSGGLDSSTALYMAKRQGFDIFCLVFDYGQQHKRELGAAKRIARIARCRFTVLKIALPWKGSSLLDKQFKIPLFNGEIKPAAKPAFNEIPSTYVPARNTIFLSFAISYAEAIGATDIFIGANALDYSGYPDCRPAYFKAFNRLAILATKRGTERKDIRIQAPLVRLKKSEIIKLGLKLGVPFDKTWSCYMGGKKPCGRCDSCVFRAKGFKEAGSKDPLIKS